MGKFYISMGFQIIPWENNSPMEFNISHGISKYPMGKQIFTWENLIFKFENLISHGNLHLCSLLSHLTVQKNYIQILILCA